MPVRIYDIALKLGLENKEVLTKAKELGIAAAKVPSSSLDKLSAEWLEDEIIKSNPAVAARFAANPAVAAKPPVPRVGDRVGFIQIAPRPAPVKYHPKPVEEKIIYVPPPILPPPPQVRISEVANKVGLPIDQVQAIVKEFKISPGLAPDSLDEDTANDLMRLVQSGKVVEKRLIELANGAKSLNLSGFPFKDAWIRRISRSQHIQELNLSHTGLSTLPDAFAELKALSVLDLSENQLKELPKWLLGFPELKAIYLQGNAALNLPNEILGPAPKEADPAKAREILDYYFRLQSGGKSPLNEAKLILLGRGEVGKTCLVNRLVDDKFIDTTMTCGISITQWKVKVGRDAIRIHIWDFGGQEIQHATHQFFLTERSLYFVVLNGRAGAEDDDAEYWLKFVKTFGSGSPTIVILNKFKVQPIEVDEAGLKEKYPFICDFIETDCVANIGFTELRASVEAALAKMDHIRVAFPAEWFQIKEKLSEMKEPFISFKQYRDLCESKQEKDSEAQETLAVFLNALGIALNFRKDARLRDETVLNPHWLTKGVYRILTSSMLAESKGELWLNRLGDILPLDEYPLRMHLFLIELMRKFDICFPYHDDELSHRYLIPELLGKKQPAFKETFPAENCINVRYDYRILPEGLFPRFITRTHVMSDPLERWRTGVVLRWEGSRALVKIDKQERQVVIRVFGDIAKRRRLLAVIRENFDHIHNEMKEYRPTEWIAIEDRPDEWVNLKDMEAFHKKNVLEVPKAVGSEVFSINVAKVLTPSDVAGAKSLDSVADAPKPRPIKAFLSYAHADERMRAKIVPNLNLLQREGLLKIWCDLEIKPGHAWDDDIKQKLEEAELYLLLVSTAFLDSEYVHSVELPIARKRVQNKAARMVPIVIKECSWKKYLGDFQVLPTSARPIKNWSDRDAAFYNVEEGLRKTILEMHQALELI